MKPNVVDLGVSKNRDTPKWMVYNGKPYCLMDDLGGKPPIFRNTHLEKPSNFDGGDHKRRLASWLEMKKLESTGYPAPELECLAWVSQALLKRKRNSNICLGGGRFWM